MSLKRQRVNEGLNLLESFGALYRQSTSRTMERLRLQIYGRETRSLMPRRDQRSGTARSVRPIDRLMIVFSMYYFYIDDLVPAHHYLRLAQDVITKSEERVKRVSQSFFEPVKSLALFCETLVEEYTSPQVEEALHTMEEIVAVREHLGGYIVEEFGSTSGIANGVMDARGLESGYYREEEGDEEGGEDLVEGGGGEGLLHSGMLLLRDQTSFMTLLGRIYQQLGFFTHIRVFILSLSREAASGLGRRLGGGGRSVIPIGTSSGKGRSSLADPRGDAFRNGSEERRKLWQERGLAFQSRYEGDLLMLLIEGAGGRRGSVAEGTRNAGGASSPSTNPGGKAKGERGTAPGGSLVKVQREEEPHVQQEEEEDEEDEIAEKAEGKSGDKAAVGTLDTPLSFSHSSLQGKEPHTVMTDIVPLHSIHMERKEDGSIEGKPEEEEDEEEEEEEEEGGASRRKRVRFLKIDEEVEEEEGAAKGTRERSAKEKKKKEGEEGTHPNRSRSSLALHQATATALLANLLALSHVPVGTEVPPDGKRTIQKMPIESHSTPSVVSPSSSPTNAKGFSLSPQASDKVAGISPAFYEMLHSRLAVMVSRQELHQFAKENTVRNVPELTPAQQQVIAIEAEARRQQMVMQAARMGSGRGGYGGGVAADYVPDEAYYHRLLRIAYGDEVASPSGVGAEARGSKTPTTAEPSASSPIVVGLGEDEELFTGEVLDYYLRRRPLAMIQDKEALRQQREGGKNHAHPNTTPSNRFSKEAKEGTSPVLIKPERVCKVKTGYTWTQYNRTHYDSRTNPPPKSVMGYDFTLFYPALAKTRRNPLTFFRVEDTPKGPTDEYCLLVFSVGPPYVDVAYRIERKPWDPRRGGVRISFDANGKFRLFFRFSNSNYRR